MRWLSWAAAALILAAPASAQQIINERGPVAHGGANTVFPVAIGEFRRAQIVAYRPDRSDMSANYNLSLPGGRLLITVYVYPSSPSADRAGACRAEFEGVGQSIVQAYGARPVESGRAPPVADVAPELSLRSVHLARMPFDGPPREVRSESRLYCFVEGRWQVKYRATASTEYAPEILERFIAQGPWPGRAAADPGTVAP